MKQMLLSELQTYSLTHLASMQFSSSSSSDNSFSFISEKGLDILELAPDPKSVSPSLSCRRYVIKPSSQLPTAQLGIDPSDLLSHLGKEEAYALIKDVTVSPKLTRTLTPIPAPRMACWSPVGILQNYRCILAVLTDMGSACLYALSENEYRQRADISTLWLKHLESKWNAAPMSQDISSKLHELKARAENVKLTAIAWLTQVKEGSGWLSAVSKSGLVSIWQVQASTTTKTPDVNATFITQFDSGLRIVSTLYWTSLPNSRSLLIVASIDGRLKSFILSSVYSSTELITPQPISSLVEIESSNELWSEQDKIATTHLSSWQWHEGLLLAAVKGAFVIMLYLNNKSEKLAYGAYRCCDTSINGLSQLSENEVLVVTRSSRFTRLYLSLTSSGKLEISTGSVESYINISHMGCYGLSMTINKVICFILLSVNQSYDHLRLREPTQVVVCSVSGLLEPQTVLQDPHKPIAQLWDCLELLRVQTLQKVIVSEVSYTREALDNMNIDQLTSTLWWVTFATAAEDDENKQHMLITLRREVESLVVSYHFFKRIATLLSYSLQSLSSFQLLSLGLLRKWLIQLQSLPKEYSTISITGKTMLQQLKVLGDRVPSEEYCSICNSIVEKWSELFVCVCDKGHTLPRCSLSLVQCCQLPYFVCAQCGALAHPQAVEECGPHCNLCGGVLRIDEEIL